MASSYRPTLRSLQRLSIRSIHTTPVSLVDSPPVRKTAESLGFNTVKRERILQPLIIPSATGRQNTNVFSKQGSRNNNSSERRIPQRSQGRNDRSSNFKPRIKNDTSPAPLKSETITTSNDGLNSIDHLNLNFPSIEDEKFDSWLNGLPDSNQSYQQSTNNKKSNRQRNLENVKELESLSISSDPGVIVQSKNGRRDRLKSRGSGGNTINNSNSNNNKDTRERSKRERPARVNRVVGVAAFVPRILTSSSTPKKVVVENEIDHSPEGLFGKKSLLYKPRASKGLGDGQFWPGGVNPIDTPKSSTSNSTSVKSILPTVPFPRSSSLSPTQRAKLGAIWSLALNKTTTIQKRLEAEEVVGRYVN